MLLSYFQSLQIYTSAKRKGVSEVFDPVFYRQQVRIIYWTPVNANANNTNVVQLVFVCLHSITS